LKVNNQSYSVYGPTQQTINIVTGNTGTAEITDNILTWTSNSATPGNV